MLEYERQAEERAKEQEAMQEERERMMEAENKMQQEIERIAQEEYEMKQYYEAEALRHAEEIRAHKEGSLFPHQIVFSCVTHSAHSDDFGVALLWDQNADLFLKK